MQQICRRFGSFTADALAALPLDPLLSLLGDDGLGVESEDQVTPYCPMPNAQCSMAQCPVAQLPNARPMPNVQLPMAQHCPVLSPMPNA